MANRQQDEAVTEAIPSISVHTTFSQNLKNHHDLVQPKHTDAQELILISPDENAVTQQYEHDVQLVSDVCEKEGSQEPVHDTQNDLSL
ncbi:hypothetical protein BOTCAL_0497g00070 [Botryotinia calthae]|uniref:Uncharacterized protein n=1 Tax=Botryotinia calthae TaxID=38488 RepID=A0A4Y8CPA5_9HELO|nr:hypothetical protein BOTCAL_0497g00070 [Botryotinia calthae]